MLTDLSHSSYPMIDWCSVVLKLKHNPFPSGKILSVDADGSVEWASVKRHQEEGSYSTKFTFKSQGAYTRDGRATELFIDGNPSKFLQGHNVFGSPNLKELLHGLFRILSQKYPERFNYLNCVMSISFGRVVRIDITKSIQFESRNQVRAYIKQLSTLAHTRNGRPQQTGWTLNFNIRSRRWGLCVYSKGDELTKRSFSPDFEHSDFIRGVADRLCRVEVRLRSLELSRLNVSKVDDFTPDVVNELYAQYINRVTMSESIEVTSDVLSGLPKVIRHTYLAWKSGIAIQAEMSKTSFYNHRSKLMAIGVDISRPYQGDDVTTNVVPLKTVIKAEPFSIPQEAIDKGLLYQYQRPLLRSV